MSRGLGFVPLAAAAPAAGPAAPLLLAASLLPKILPAFKIRAGANEADAIVPTQEKLGRLLGDVDKEIPVANVARLQQLQSELSRIAQEYLAFLTDPQFTDGRASVQSANAIMPMLDGTGGYTWPAMQGHPVSVDAWGNPTNGGRLGTIARRIAQLGGSMRPATVGQGAAGGIFPTLQVPTASGIPQAGTLPARTQQAGLVAAPETAHQQLLMYGALAVAALVLFQR